MIEDLNVYENLLQKITCRTNLFSENILYSKLFASSHFCTEYSAILIRRLISLVKYILPGNDMALTPSGL